MCLLHYFKFTNFTTSAMRMTQSRQWRPSCQSTGSTHSITRQRRPPLQGMPCAGGRTRFGSRWQMELTSAFRLLKRLPMLFCDTLPELLQVVEEKHMLSGRTVGPWIGHGPLLVQLRKHGLVWAPPPYAAIFFLALAVVVQGAPSSTVGTPLCATKSCRIVTVCLPVGPPPPFPGHNVP